MTVPPSTHQSRKLIELIGTDWVDIETVINNTIPVVAPGKALRTFQDNSKSPERFSEDEQIYRGARSIVRQSLNDFVRSGRFEKDPTGKKVKSRDKCPACERPFVKGSPTRTTSPTRATNVIRFPIERRHAS